MATVLGELWTEVPILYLSMASLWQGYTILLRDLYIASQKSTALLMMLWGHSLAQTCLAQGIIAIPQPLVDQPGCAELERKPSARI